MANQANVPGKEETYEFLSQRCEETEREFVKANPVSQDAVEYNDKLADHWHPGIKTRSQTLEETEKRIFVDMAVSEWLAGRRDNNRQGRRALIIDQGGGNGKVVDWIDSLVEKSPNPVTYLYTDISPQMRDRAKERFEAMKARHPGRKLRAHFPLADATKPMFSAREWSRLRKHFFPIIGVCAGGTIGNFGKLSSEDNSAQDLALKRLEEASDATLVTFLEPARIDLSLKAYSTFGTSSGMYDGQAVRLFAADNGKERLHHERIVPFGNGELKKDIAELTEIVKGLGSTPCWAKFEMIKEQQPVGQVTRHYSRDYVRKRFLNGSALFRQEACDRARIYACAPGH